MPPSPVYVSRFTPARPYAGGMSTGPFWLSWFQCASYLPGPHDVSTACTAGACNAGESDRISPGLRSRFGQPSSRRPMPGASELSTVAWHRAHVTPKRVILLVASTLACTPTTAFSASRATVVAGSSRLTCPALSCDTSAAGSASTSTLRPTPSAVLGLMPCTTWCILSVSVQNASSPKVSNRKMCCPSNSVRSIGELVGDAVQATTATSTVARSQRCLIRTSLAWGGTDLYKKRRVVK